MTDFAPPGYYPAKGDPPGTVRAWDGRQWTSEAIAPPPGWDPSGPDPRFATAGIRVGASLLDGLVTFLAMVPFMIPWFIDVIDQINEGVAFEEVDTSAPWYFYVVALAGTAVMAAMVAFLGGTPGKLILKLRITTEDGTTTPPGPARAARRAIPQLVGAVPVIGPLIGLTVQILSLVWVNTDAERRSAYDRIAGTRVVYRHHL